MTAEQMQRERRRVARSALELERRKLRSREAHSVLEIADYMRAVCAYEIAMGRNAPVSGRALKELAS